MASLACQNNKGIFFSFTQTVFLLGTSRQRPNFNNMGGGEGGGMIPLPYNTKQIDTFWTSFE